MAFRCMHVYKSDIKSGQQSLEVCEWGKCDQNVWPVAFITFDKVCCVVLQTFSAFVDDQVILV